MSNSCAFSGHRDLYGTGFDYALLERVIKDLVKLGTDRFLCGMAAGFDMCAAEAVLSLKKRYKIKLVACIPCANQTEKYSGFARQRYEKILSKCDEKIVLSAYYYPGCMHERNRYMVDNCDSVVCFLRKDSGGTFYTVNYARKYNKTIIEL